MVPVKVIPDPAVYSVLVSACSATSFNNAAVTLSSHLLPDAKADAVVLSWPRTTVSVFPLIAVTFTTSTTVSNKLESVT